MIAQIHNNGLCKHCGAVQPKHNEGCRVLEALRAKLSGNAGQRAADIWQARQLEKRSF